MAVRNFEVKYVKAMGQISLTYFASGDRRGFKTPSACTQKAIRGSGA